MRLRAENALGKRVLRRRVRRSPLIVWTPSLTMEQMTKSQALRGLRSRLDAPFAAQGFEFMASRGAYRRVSELGAELVHCRVIVVGGVVRLELSASIRFDEVEAIYHRTSGAPDDAKGMTSTLWIDCEALTGWPLDQCQKKIRSEEDLDGAADAVRRFWQEHAAGYFTQNLRLEAADRLLNAAPLERSVHFGWPGRGSYGIILAALVKRADFDELAARHREAVAKIDRGFHLPAFDACVADLRKSVLGGGTPR